MSIQLNKHLLGSPGSSVAKNLPANAGDVGLIPDPGRSHMLRSNKPVCHNYSALELWNCNYWAATIEAYIIKEILRVYFNEKESDPFFHVERDPKQVDAWNGCDMWEEWKAMEVINM